VSIVRGGRLLALLRAVRSAAPARIDARRRRARVETAAMNAGRRALLAEMRKRSKTQTEIAKAVGVSQSTISDLLRDRGTLPRLDLAFELERVFGVLAHSWLEE
jgi:plasmid maintenance system antidote protein VapI